VPSFRSPKRSSCTRGKTLLLHLADKHGYPSVRRCPFRGLLCTGRGLNTHMRGHFKKEALGLVGCPQCVPLNDEKAPVFSELSSWLAHATAWHNHWSSVNAMSHESGKRKRKPMEDSDSKGQLLSSSDCWITSERTAETGAQSTEPEPGVSFLPSPAQSQASKEVFPQAATGHP